MNDIITEIWNALRKEDTLQPMDLSSLSIHIKDGEVHLVGHMIHKYSLDLVEKIARSTLGVEKVTNHLVLDRDLIWQITQALSNDERTRRCNLPVSVMQGWVQVGGEAPDREIQALVQEIAAKPDGTRGVISLPRISGENASGTLSTQQPRIGSIVNADVGGAGALTHVVIWPGNRLVTHVVVRSSQIRDTYLVTYENLVPVEAIRLVNDESIFLARNGLPLNAYPVFDPDAYPAAPFTWKAPYPYTTSEVRWSLRDVLENGGLAELNPLRVSQPAPDQPGV